MPHPAEHSALLARRDFVIPPGDFTESERSVLARYGRWLDALASGAIQPTTSEQERFVKVARGQCEPETDFERAWVKVILQRNGVEEVVRTFQWLSQARRAAAEVEAEYRAARANVLALVRDQLDAVDRVFAERVEETTRDSSAAEQAVRELVLRLGRGVRLAGIRAAYYPGRVSWDTTRLDEYAQAHPEVEEFRKIGKAWVNLRFLDEGAPADSRQTPKALGQAEGRENDRIKALPADGAR